MRKKAPNNFEAINLPWLGLIITIPLATVTDRLN